MNKFKTMFNIVGKKCEKISLTECYGRIFENRVVFLSNHRYDVQINLTRKIGYFKFIKLKKVFMNTIDKDLKDLMKDIHYELLKDKNMYQSVQISLKYNVSKENYARCILDLLSFSNITNMSLQFKDGFFIVIKEYGDVESIFNTGYMKSIIFEKESIVIRESAKVSEFQKKVHEEIVFSDKFKFDYIINS